MSYKPYNIVNIDRLQKLIDTEKSRNTIAQNIGCDVSTITKHYNGDRIVTIDFLKKYADYFDVSADYLLGLADVPTTDKDLQFVCDYTGLSQATISALHECKYLPHIEYDPIVVDKFPSFVDRFVEALSKPKKKG